MNLKIVSRQIAAGVVGICLVLSYPPAKAASPAIVITNLAAFGTAGGLSGYVTNAVTATNSVAVYVFVGGDWYSQPSCADQLTTIQSDGGWNLASLNTSASEIAAFLVPNSYSNCVNGATGLPIPTQAEATVYADRVNSSVRTFDFSGYNWSVRPGSYQGSGPNYYTTSTNNIWVDAQGLLHMKITYTSNQWQCVEIISDRSFGYGQYRFTVVSPTDIDSLDPSVVLGMFLWSYDRAYNDREIDMEVSRWNYKFGTSNVEDYSVAPYGAGQVHRFSLPAGVTNSTHSFIWQPTNIAFQSLNGNFASPPASSNILQSWNCAIGTPPAGGEQVQMNLWLNKGNAPVYGQPVEVIISNFEFVPLGPPQPAQVTQLSPLPGGNVQLSVQGVSDWHYQILSSPDLVNWMEIGTVLATNNSISYSSLPVLFQFTDTNPASSDACFYRTWTEP